MPDLALRPVIESDEQFLVEVYASTRADELALTGWNDAQSAAFVKMQFAAQYRHYRERYPEATYQVIQFGAVPIGRLYLATLADEIRVLDLTILPEYRNRSFGTAILREVMKRAAAERKAMTIYVETFNPSLTLFDRLGFVKIGEHGYSYLLEWRPPPNDLAEEQMTG